MAVNWKEWSREGETNGEPSGVCFSSVSFHAHKSRQGQQQTSQVATPGYTAINNSYVLMSHNQI